MDRINGADTVDIGAGRRGFRDENLEVGIAGTEVTAFWLNSIQEEIVNVIDQASLAPSSGSWAQLYQAIAGLSQSGRWNYAEAGGTANALTITLAPAPVSMASIKGALIQILITTSNTDAVTANINGIGVVNVLRIDGAPLQKGDLIAGRILTFMFNGTALVAQGFAPSLIKARLAANLTIAVNSSTGNDTTGNLTNPFRTLQAAVDYVYRNVDLNGFNVLFMAAGAFTAGVSVYGLFMGQGEASQVTINLGSATINAANGNCFSVNNGRITVLNGGQLSATGSGAGQGCVMSVGGGGEIQFGQTNFANCTQAHILVSSGGSANAIQDYTISSTSALYHLSAISFGSISISGRVVVMSAGLTASTFASSLQGAIYAVGTTFTGAGVAAAVCPKFNVDVWGSIFVGGAGINLFPGNSPGTVAAKGDYR